MAKLSTTTRNALPGSNFGLPNQRKYPMPNKSHAANAKARATQQVKAGNLSPSAKAQIDAKANKVLHGNSAAKAPKAPMTTQMVKAIKNSPKGSIPPGLARYLAAKKAAKAGK